MVPSTPSDSSQSAFFEANGVYFHEMTHYSNENAWQNSPIVSEPMEALTLPVSTTTRSRKTRPLRVSSNST